MLSEFGTGSPLFIKYLQIWSSKEDNRALVSVKEISRETTLCLAAAHALVRLDDGIIVGDPMEKTTLEALDWKLSKGDHNSRSRR